ncbi:MAG: hypothetical protein EOR01_28195 [Mesorhizobium sp.]|uniref:hypothetical protein n=1 Tax=Mesorhizobium sp. TaxID=1871066 RepID=UPI000FE68333|nr:hypothetical protein [Mesorhizobium sp.]RWP16099.1 MAG: hypothetical protein EOR01_28195 [Mesorhizobium sp.]
MFRRSRDGRAFIQLFLSQGAMPDLRVVRAAACYRGGRQGRATADLSTAQEEQHGKIELGGVRRLRIESIDTYALGRILDVLERPIPSQTA